MVETTKNDNRITFASAKKFIKECFSFDGYCDTGLFIWAMFFGCVIKDFLKLFENEFISLIGIFCSLYIYMAAFQKRCRDINIKGTLIILIASIYFIFLSDTFDWKTINFTSIKITDVVSIIFILLYYIVFLFLLLIPGEKDKNPKLTSPLLKKPIIYIGVCFMILLACRYGVFMYYR